jgi:hypothetical protein
MDPGRRYHTVRGLDFMTRVAKARRTLCVARNIYAMSPSSEGSVTDRLIRNLQFVVPGVVPTDSYSDFAMQFLM